METYEKTGGLPEGLKIARAEKTGYEVLTGYESWKVAAITYAERFDRKKIKRLERHKETDEVFILAKGQAQLLIGERGETVGMEPYQAYNVKRGTWHGICVSLDAMVLICEEANTGPDNTDYMEWTVGAREERQT